MILRSPYPWFGGKSAVACDVWRRFGAVRNYVEPFFGSGAVLLARPEPIDGTETINDLDGFVPNFWRAIAADPAAVAQFADWPVSECDLHARHLWLANEGRRHVERLKTEPDYYDAKIAGWWVWGLCQWIGSGWCEHLGGAGMGVHRPSQQLPHLGNAGMGVHRPSQQLPHLGDAGSGVHRPHQKLPHLGNAGRGVHRPSQDGEGGRRKAEGGRYEQLTEYFGLIADRMRGVRICCGDWSRVCGPSPTTHNGLTAVFLDPPYSRDEREPKLYAIEGDVAGDVRAWCLANGDNSQLRIALCGYAGEGHEPLIDTGWTEFAWKAKGGYAHVSGGDNSNCRRERIWFSPACIDVDAIDYPLFAGYRSPTVGLPAEF